jgi:hypothetical protein
LKTFCLEINQHATKTQIHEISQKIDYPQDNFGVFWCFSALVAKNEPQ